MARLGDLIKLKRERMGLSLRDFAEMCNMSHSYIRNLEYGDPRTGKDIVPTLDYLEKLAPVLDMSLEDLLRGIGYIQEMNNQFEPSDLKLLRQGKKSSGSFSHLRDELQRFVADPLNEEYLKLAKELRDKNIKVRFVRETFFEE